MAFALTIYEIVCTDTKARNIIRNHNQIAKVVLSSLLFVSFLSLQAQDRKKSPVYRNYEAAYIPLVLPSTLDLQLLEAFVLMQKANTGESPAQHELGLRYLLGKGFPADTAKAAYWIQKAADQRLPIAQFNLGILSINGRGIEWNPFTAYKWFKAAADQGHPEALYVMGLFYTENFIVQRNWQKAYQLFKKSSELGSESAIIALKEMQKRGLDKIDPKKEIDKSSKKSSKAAEKDTVFNLLFIDFHSDTTTAIDDTILLREAYRGIDTLEDAATEKSSVPARIDSSAKSLFAASAESGNPEALCLLGRCYERGLFVRKNIILAGVYYLRALHLDSYRAPALLWKLMNTDEFVRELELRSSKNDPDALYVWSGLTYTNFSKVLNEKQAFDLLQRAALIGHNSSIIELGSCYFSGRWVQQNRIKAVDLWNNASAQGSLEASIRISAAKVLHQIESQDLNEAFSILRSTAKDGSLFSDLTLAYCYEKGFGLTQNKGEAYRIFHRSLLRGSETAFHALRRMHDELRPDVVEFKIQDE